MNKKYVVNKGIGLCSVLTIVFITLKVLNLITWNWLWVLSPLLISITLKILLLIIIFVLSLVKHRIDR